MRLLELELICIIECFRCIFFINQRFFSCFCVKQKKMLISVSNKYILFVIIKNRRFYIRILWENEVFEKMFENKNQKHYEYKTVCLITTVLV